ncbi:telomere binding protein, partial [Coemansia sp. RSA 2702]
GDSVDRAVSAVLTRFGASGAGVSGTLSRWSALGTYQAIALALQLLSGKPVESGIADALPARVFPELLGEALGRVIVPLWALPEHVHGGQLEAVKALSALVMMCLGAATAAEGRALSMSPAFMQAVPRYLDAPVPLVRLSGVIVADRIVSLAQRASDSDSIDFGLQDILDEAHDTDQPVVRASAEYIAEMRKYSRPVAEQWADAEPTADGESGSAQSLVEALGRVQELGAEGADEQAVLAPRQSTLTGEAGVESAYVRPRPPVYLRDCLAYLRDRAEGSERVEVALFALAGCVERANVKAVEELWVQLANKVLYTYNRGPDRLDAAWDAARQRALVALAVRLPQQMGPYLADRSCDRNLTLADRELVLSAIGTACLRLSGRESEGSGIEDVTDEQGSQGVPDSAGTVVRRSRRLDIAARRPAPSADPAQRAYAGLAGPAFFLPLAAQFGRSDTSAQASDVRGDAGQLARYVDVLGVILYSAPAATHQLAMARAFLGLVGLVQRLPARTGEARPVLDALLFGIDALLTPGRALSTPTLAREFGGELGGVLRWIGALLERGLLGESAAAAHAARIVERLREIQADVGRRVASSDFDRYTSII